MSRSAAAPTAQRSLINMNLTDTAPLSARYRQAKKRKARTFWWWARRASLACVVLVLMTGGLLLGKGYFKFHKVFKGGGTAVALQAQVDPSLLKGEGDGRVNVLLLGKGGPGHEAPDLTDTLLLASIDPINKTASLVSVPRDLWVTAPSGGSSKLNAVYANTKSRALAKAPSDTAVAEAAGIAAAQQTVSQVFDLPIHYHAMVDFTAFKEAVDTVGGITINVPEELVDSSMAWENNWSSVLARPGVQVFDGKRALLYARSRHGSARGDFDRTERQRLLIMALEQKILSAGTYTNPLKLSQLLSAFGDHVTTDISTTDAGRLLSIFKSIGGKMTSLELAAPPHDYLTTGSQAGQSVVRPRAGISNFAEIQAYLRLALRDGYLIKENAKIAVFNGSTKPTAATDLAGVLSSYGYAIATVGEAPTRDYAQTTLIDLSQGANKYTKNYLEKRLGVKAVSKPPANLPASTQAQFAIIVGQR